MWISFLSFVRGVWFKTINGFGTFCPDSQGRQALHIPIDIAAK